MTHIILLMADHLRRDAIPCYGSLGPRTPELDAVSRESVVFDGAYCSTPLCVPTRNSIYSGQWPHSSGSIVNGGRYPEEQPYALLAGHHRTIYEQLAEAGYGINCFGLTGCHSARPVGARVAGAVVNPGPSVEDYLRANKLDGTAVAKMMAPYRRPCPEYVDGRMVMKDFPTPRALGAYPLPAETFPDLWHAANAERHIAGMDFNRPQFLEVLFASPHPPLTAPEPWYSMYDPGQIKLGPTVAQWCPGQPATLMRNFCGYLGTGLARGDWPAVYAVHFALTSLVDHCIGRVVAALKARGVWDNCLVITQTDHGEMLGCHALWEKHCCYEEAAHIPMLIKPPASAGTGLTRGADGFARRGQLTGHIDLAPTMCDYAGVPALPGAQGRSLRAVIEDPGAAWRDIQFMEFNGNHGRGTPVRAAVARRAGRTVKYIYNFGDVDELYDLSSDPFEERSLVTGWEYQGMRTELRGKMAEWMRETGDYLDLG